MSINRVRLWIDFHPRQINMLKFIVNVILSFNQKNSTLLKTIRSEVGEKSHAWI